jgi:hypothetical protein
MRLLTKAQAEQIFVVIISLIIAALIFIYGFKAIQDFTQRTEDISLTSFQTKLQSSVRTIASDYGSVKILDIGVPSKFNKVCFLDYGYGPKKAAGLCNSFNEEDYNSLICDAWMTPGYGKENYAQNVFFVPMADSPVKVGALTIDTGYICVPVKGGKVKVRLEGLGDSTKVSLP